MKEELAIKEKQTVKKIIIKDSAQKETIFLKDIFLDLDIYIFENSFLKKFFFESIKQKRKKKYTHTNFLEKRKLKVKTYIKRV